MLTRRLSPTKIVYLILLAVSAIAGAYSGYTWEPEPAGMHASPALGHSWFTDAYAGAVPNLGSTFGRDTAR